MVNRHGLPSGRIDSEVHPIPGFEPFGRNGHSMSDRVTLRLHVDDVRFLAVPGEPTGVEGLAPAFGIKGGLLDKYICAIGLTRDRKDIGNVALCLKPVITDEARRPSRDRRRKVARRAPAAVALVLHQCGHCCHVDRYASFLSELGGQLHRKAQRVMQVEHFFGV